FVVGETVSVVSLTTGQNLATGLAITAATTPGADGGTTTDLTFDPATVPAGLCVHFAQAVFVAEQIAVGLPGTQTPPPAGSTVTVTTPSGVSTTTTVSMTSGSTIFLNGAQALAQGLGGCFLGSGVNGGALNGTCLPGTFLPAGSVLQSSATVGAAPIHDADGSCIPEAGNAPSNGAEADVCGSLFGGQGPYPFWQFLPNPAAGGETTATMYSDNHGEAIVALSTGVGAATIAASCPTGYTQTGGTCSNGTKTISACPAGYLITPDNSFCLLNLASLGSATTAPGGVAFQNIAAAHAFTAATPGCIQTNPNGSTTAVTATTLAVGATGPANGQICVNSLGGLEFGQGASLGTTTVQAIADYPYTRGLHAPISSGAITKVFTSAFNKSVTVTPLAGATGCTPGTAGCGIAGPAGTTTYTVTITGTDICGQPILGEPVNVFALGNAGGVVLAPLGPGSSNGTNAATVQLSTGTGAFTGIAAGTALLSLEVLNTAIGNTGLVIKAVFPLERIERFVTVIPGQTAPNTVTVLYPPGYNMIGGPPGSNFGQAEAIFSYDPTAGTYGNATASESSISSAAPSCTGYYAYFASATSVSLNVTSHTGDTAACALKAGWNLVGNPFGTPAALPTGTIAYHFNGTTYDVVSAIPVGGAVFIYEAADATLTLTAS
ncbi:MAG: hypothetical protein ACRDGS_17095, partial [Chloroflexota bacterium]